MKIYVILKEDHGYNGYGTDVGGGNDIEEVFRSFEDVEEYLLKNYMPLYKMSTEPVYSGCSSYIKAAYRYFDEHDSHAYEFWVYEKELA